MGLKDMLAARSQIQTGIASTTSENPTDINFDPTKAPSAESEETNLPSSDVTNDSGNDNANNGVGDSIVLADEEQAAAEQSGPSQTINWEQPVRFAQYHIRRIQDRGWHYPVDGYFYAKNERQLATLKFLNKEGYVVAENYTSME